eukprot:COSAG01_NODE_1_length_100484_cov_170.446142_38_plen_202_part_00
MILKTSTPHITHLCGLGNPGEQYRSHRHNVGFMLLHYLESQYPASHQHQKHRSLLKKMQIDQQLLNIIYPQDYMNNSGQCLKKVLQADQITPQRCLVIYDDVDLPFGTVRLREKGSAGTHNGLRDIVDHLQSKDIPRLRIGIRPLHPVKNLADFVLSPFTKQEQLDLNTIFEHCHDVLKSMLKEGVPKAMSVHNAWQLSEA